MSYVAFNENNVMCSLLKGHVFGLGTIFYC